MAESVKSPMVTSAKQPTECIHMGQSMREREREEEQKISLSIKLSTSFSLTANIDNIRDQRSLRGKGEDEDVYSLLPDLDHVRFKTLHSSKLQGSFLLRISQGE